MLGSEDLANTMELFGVSPGQVRRDHFISHVLAALAELDLPVVFFGGTALARTHLTDPNDGARLSEDIDLYSSERQVVAAELDRRLPAALRREFPGSSWDPSLIDVRNVDPGQLLSRDGIRLRIQLLDSAGEYDHLARWPTEPRQVELRYRDLKAGVRLQVPTLPSFAAMKTMAWMDRRTARDLYDLAKLAQIGALTREVAASVKSASGISVVPYAFSAFPGGDWEAQLAHQTRKLPPAEECLRLVRDEYAKALDWD